MSQELNQPVEVARAPSSPSHRRSVSLAAPNSEGGDRNSKYHNASDVVDMLNSVEFIPPVEGTPAALALAANAAIKVTKLDKGLHKFRGMKRPKMKSLNIVKKLNKITKSKRSKRHFSKNFKGKVIDGVHELYTLTAGMMLGIRFSLVRGYEVEAYNDNQVHEIDFDEVENVAFPPKGSTTPPFITPPHSLAHTFKFKSYAPKIFKQLREFFDIDPVDYMQSVCGDYNYLEFISNSKSGQFFFYSHDGKYMLKTQTKEENKFLKRILPQYFRYLKENPHSLLVRILGMHRIKMYHLRRKVHFVIMSSVFDTPAQINTIYDLKGSLVGRSATEKERQSGGVLKDCDMLDDHRKLHLGPKKVNFMRQLQKDARFLSSLNVMDYSLLVGIHDRRTRNMDVSVVGTTSILKGSEIAQPSATTHSSGHNLEQAQGTAHSSANTPSTSVTTDKHSSAVHSAVQSHSNTPFRRSIHIPDPSVLASPALANNRRSSLASKKPEDPGDPILNFAHLYDSKDGFEHELRDSFEAPGPGGLSRDDSVPRQLSFHARDRRRSTGQGQSLGASEDDQVNVHRMSLPQPGATKPDARPPQLENELLLVNQLDDPVESDNDEDDADYEDIDDGDSDDGEAVAAPEHVALNLQHLSVGPGPAPAHVDHVDIESNDGGGPAPSQALEAAPNPLGFKYEIVYGNGITTRRPWTSRKDMGINSRDPHHSRGNEIYFVGIIDILQEYNTGKRMETMLKGLTNDSRYISSVDPVSYAKRFVKFMDSNID